jgi:AAA+ ATPase superfamily predicted ATPase
LFTDPSVLIGRKGTIDRPIYIDTPFWTIDTLFYRDIDTSKANVKFIYYLFQSINWYKYIEAVTFFNQAQEFNGLLDISQLMDEGLKGFNDGKFEASISTAQKVIEMEDGYELIKSA